MWPVVDNSGTWIGYLALATFKLDGTNKVSYDKFLAHMGLSTPDNNAGTSHDSTILCLDCNGECVNSSSLPCSTCDFAWSCLMLCRTLHSLWVHGRRAWLIMYVVV